MSFLRHILTAFIVMFNILIYNAVFAENKYAKIADDAIKAYNEGQYFYAIELYDSILQNGYTSAALYYNLGNAYFKTSQMPNAILYYEKAKKLSPADENINFNLNLANTLITDKIDEIPLLFYQKWWKNMYSSYSVDTWAVLSIIASLLLFSFLATYLISNKILLKKLSFYLFVLFFICLVFTTVFAQKQYNKLYKEQYAIVFSPRVTVKSSPDDNSVDLFVIHEGTKVYINDNLGEWYEIKLANGNVGWIKKNVVKNI